MANRFVTSIYCDDIRMEVGNKHSYIGVYYGAMFVPQMPIVLPKLCVSVSVMTPVQRPFKKLLIRLLKGDNTLGQYDVDEKILINQANFRAPKLDETGDQLIVFGTSFVFAPFEIDKETMLRIRVQTEDEELKGPGLSIEVTPTQLT